MLLASAAQAVYDYTKGALDISKNPTKASNYLVMLPAIGYAVKAPLKRGVEVAMRTSNNANPIEDIVYNMHKASPKKHAGVLSYISTGVGYNTYAPEAYTGFQKAAKGNDMIDAYLYNKTINPSYGVKKINVDYGPHENYIRKIYPYKDIPVYENTETLDFFTKKPMQKASDITNKTPWKGANNNLDFGDNGVDAAGHLVQEGTSNGKKVYRAQDIWKFNPDEYGSIAGGRIIIQAGKEVRLVSGSIDNIRDEIEAMKSRNNVKTVDLYTLDNGTYHSGLRTFDKIFTRDDLLEYDAQNTGGGNFLYIK